MIMMSIVRFYFVFIVLVSVFSCQSKNAEFDVIKGQELVIEFDQLATYSTSDFFYIDDYKILHELRFDSKEVVTDEQVLIQPTDYLFFATDDGDRKTQKTSAFEMCYNLGVSLLQIKDDNGNGIYRIKNLPAWKVTGTLTLVREDGKDIVLRIPKEYPLFVERQSD